MKSEKRKGSFTRNVLVLLFVLGLCIGMACLFFLGPCLSSKRSVGSLEHVEVNIRMRETAVFYSSQNDVPGSPQCTLPSPNDRFDCFPDDGSSQEKCEARGCCWVPASSEKGLRFLREVHMDQAVARDRGKYVNEPYCFFPVNYPGYISDTPAITDYGFQATLTRSTLSPWPNDVMKLKLEVYEETPSRLHFKIVDAAKQRYEVPLNTPNVTKKSASTDYQVEFTQQPFGLKVTRKVTGAVLFDTNLPGAPLVYADQFLQLSTQVPSGQVFGLGEHEGPFAYNFSTWQDIAIWARDAAPVVGRNLYGSHPFYLAMEDDASAHGVFLLNSNAMDILLQPTPALTYRTIGGIFDFYIFTGPTPDEVISQYGDVIGRPVLTPYWGLGFHLCRYNYSNDTELQTVISRMRAANFLYEAQWSDIDYMEGHLDWTFDKNTYGNLQAIVQDLHAHHQRYVVIVDPGIYTLRPGNYKPYDDGIKRGVFVRNATGQPLVGRVWPGPTVFPDFTHPDAADWWYECAKDFHDQIPFDGLWTDMNEPSNFVTGSSNGCTDSNLDKPPYTPEVLGSLLISKTICMSAQQSLSSHYNLHSLYGHFECVATKQALERLYSKERSFIISRSTFAGTGHFASHWLGDNRATWDHLYYSIPGILSFQMFGIPLVGADICGFMDDTTPELCTRWMQLGAFYPFMRNHNNIHSKDQDPAVFAPDVQARMRSVLQIRYTLLPLLYTLFYDSHTNGTMVARPLLFQYPTDKTTYNIDRQFMWGDVLMISPVLTEGATSVEAYMPDDTWYDYYTGQKVTTRGQWVQLAAPIDKINLHLRGDSVVITQPPLTEVTTVKARYNYFAMTIALCRLGEASGKLIWDDGISRDSMSSGRYNLVTFNVKQGTLTSQVINSGFEAENEMKMNNITILGLDTRPSKVELNGNTANFDFNDQYKVLYVMDFEPISLLKPLTIHWE